MIFYLSVDLSMNKEQNLIIQQPWFQEYNHIQVISKFNLKSQIPYLGKNPVFFDSMISYGP